MIGAVPVASFPVDIPATSTMDCTFSGGLNSAASANVATASYGGGDVVAEAPIDWSKAVTTETNECADVTDTLGGALGGMPTDATKNSPSIPYTIGQYDVCGDYTVDNTLPLLLRMVPTRGRR
jgi:hypothetical protein